VKSSGTKQFSVQPLVLPPPAVVVHRLMVLVHPPMVQFYPLQEPDEQEVVGGAVAEDKLPLRNMTMLCNDCNIFMCVPRPIGP
jgi:hypothetical protein